METSSFGNILIADAGSTKIDWCIISSTGEVICNITTPGINIAIASEQEIHDCFLTARETLNQESKPAAIFYYGAGCASPNLCKEVADALSTVWGATHVEAASDMLGACRALLKDSPGVACILGTGSNSALYDGNAIIANTPPLGYILGDEGGGAALGKRLVSDIFKGLTPTDITSNFLTETGLTKEDVIRKVYREPAANRFLASLAPFIAHHISEEYLRNLVRQEFSRFIRRNLLQYPDIENLPISFIGSIAIHFKDILLEVIADMNLSAGKIIKSPMEGLIEFHKYQESNN